MRKDWRDDPRICSWGISADVCPRGLVVVLASRRSEDRESERSTSGDVVEVRDLSVNYGGVRALDGVTCGFPVQSVVAVVGTNGAGKTTLFRAITQQVKSYTGEVLLDRRSIVGLKPHDVVRLGLAKTYQNIQLFGALSVFDNISMGVLGTCGYKWFSALFPTPGALAAKRLLRESVEEIAQLLGLSEQLEKDVRELSYGYRKRVEVARALATRPRVLLLDEPSSGLSRAEVDELAELVENVRRNVETIVLIEHNLGLVLRCAERVVALDAGRVRFQGDTREFGTPDELKEIFGL